MSRPFTHAVVGVTDLDESLRLWNGTFGMSILDRTDGPDAELEQLWDLGSVTVRRQALVGMPDNPFGRMHLVEFSDPGPVVREGAAAFDLCPKNLDVRLRDMDTRFDELVAAGWTMGSKPVRMPVETMEVLEVQLKGPDATNLSLVEVVGSDLPYTDEGYVAVTQVVGITPDNHADRAFFEDVFGLEPLMYHLFEGPEVERMVGLPEGSKLDMHILGVPDEEMGRIELVQYVGVEGRDLYPSTEPPARGFLRVAFEADDLGALLARATSAGHVVEELPAVSTMTGSGKRALLRSPGGWQIEVMES